jgi:glycosyl transferase family 25
MDALVINLKRSADRMAFQASQLERLGIHYQRISAIDAGTLDADTYQAKAYDWERPLRDTEVACCLSHAKAWQIVLESNRPHLVLEDDALLCSKAGTLLNALESYQNYDCVNLETRGRRKTVSKKKTPLIDDFKISKLIQDKSGAAAYVLWPDGAKKLLNWIETRGLGLADAILAVGPRLRHGQVEPAAALQLDCCHLYGIECPLETQTHIHHVEKPKASKTLPFRWRRLRAQLKIALRKGCAFATAESKEIIPHRTGKNYLLNKKELDTHIFLIHTEFHLFFCLQIIQSKNLKKQDCMLKIENVNRLLNSIKYYKLENISFSSNGIVRCNSSKYKNIHIYSDRYFRKSNLRRIREICNVRKITYANIIPDGISYHEASYNFHKNIKNSKGLNKNIKIKILNFEILPSIHYRYKKVVEVIPLEPLNKYNAYDRSVLLIGGEFGLHHDVLNKINQREKAPIAFKKHPADKRTYDEFKGKFNFLGSGEILEDMILSHCFKKVYSSMSTSLYIAHTFAGPNSCYFVYDKTNPKDVHWLPFSTIKNIRTITKDQL